MNKRSIAYWTAQLLGWGLYTTFLIVTMVAFGEGVEHKGKIVALQLTIGISCLLVSHIARNFIKKRGWAEYPIGELIPRVLVLNLIAAILVQVIIHAVMLTLLDWQQVRPIVWQEIPVYTFNVFILFTVWSVFYFGFHYFEQSRRSKMEKLQAENALKDAELIALKAQINPHFLFNSLNNIRALILENPMRARDMVSNLSDLLRYSIRFSNQEKVPLKSEMEIVENYLQLESVQYEDRLDYRLEIAPETLEHQIPPMIVQLLVENAVKHGISQLPSGGQIRIRTQLMDQDLVIVVENTGKLEAKRSNGIGIKNALERIRILFSIEPFFDLSESEGKVRAIIKLPTTT